MDAAVVFWSDQWSVAGDQLTVDSGEWKVLGNREQAIGNRRVT